MPRFTLTPKGTHRCIFGSGLHSMDQVFTVYSVARAASVPKPAADHSWLPGTSAPRAGSGVIPLVCPARKPRVCPVLSPEGRDSHGFPAAADSAALSLSALRPKGSGDPHHTPAVVAPAGCVPRSTWCRGTTRSRRARALRPATLQSHFDNLRTSSLPLAPSPSVIPSFVILCNLLKEFHQ